MLKFRNLRPDEIEVRPTDTNKKGKATLLLYKDARTDRRILDETVGPENWQCDFYEVNGATFCRVGIWDETKNQWIWKSDCGTESNIEKEKGLASDAFKRACFKFSIGSELYATPKIKIDCPDKYYFNDRMTMTFSVSRFKAEGEEVKELEIVDRFGKVVYALGDKAPVRYTETKAAKKAVEPERYEDTDDEQAAQLSRLQDFVNGKKEENYYWAWSFGRYWKGLIKEGQYPKSLNALWKKWISLPARDDDEAEWKKWKKAQEEAKRLSDNE